MRQVQVTFDCAQPVRLARFWCEVLGYELAPPPECFDSWEAHHPRNEPDDTGSHAVAVDPTARGPRLFFQRVPQGKIAKNRLHLDVRVGTGLVGAERLAALEAEQHRLTALGATHLYTLYADEDNESCVVMQDVEGNEFCLD